MIFAALDESAARGELLLVAGGLCRFHLRRDGVVTIREIVVLPEVRRTGIGSRLVDEVQRRNPARTLRASCPAALPANQFWRGLAFDPVAERNGVVVWERRRPN